MRSRAASGSHGLAGMAALVETSDLRLLRPIDLPAGVLEDLPERGNWQPGFNARLHVKRDLLAVERYRR